MQLQITNCLMAWCTNPTRLQSLSVWRDHVTITVTTWEHMESVEELGTFKARSPSHSSAFMDFNAASSQTCWEWLVGVHFSLLYSTSRLLAVIFISLHICTGYFIVKRFAQGQEPILPLLCHFIVYTSRRLYAIPHAISVTMSVIILYMLIGGDDCVMIS